MKNKKVKMPELASDDVLIVKVGTEDYPASEEAIRDVQLCLSQCAADKNLCFVTHHRVGFTVLKRALLKNLIVCADIEKIK